MKLVEGLRMGKLRKGIWMGRYYGWIVCEVLGGEMDGVLYLECEMVIVGEICEYWNSGLENERGVGGVEEMGWNEGGGYEIVKYGMEDCQLNGGVVLMKVDQWGKNDVGDGCVDQLEKYGEGILFNDEDLLKRMVEKNKILVKLKWNVEDGFYGGGKEMDEGWKEKLCEVLKEGVIVDQRNGKGWEYESEDGLREVYLEYVEMSRWKGEGIVNKGLEEIKGLLGLLGLGIEVRKGKYINMEDI